MNTLVQGALNKLIQDEKFRGELLGMLDEVNRSAQDPSLISREADTAAVERANPPPPPAPPANNTPPAPEQPAGKFEDVKAELLADPAFLKALIDALTNLNQGDQQARAALNADVGTLRESVETLSRTMKELNTTITEHDAVITAMAEKALVAEGEKSTPVRARSIMDNTLPPTKKGAGDFGDRAAKVLVKMGAK